jgi:hypothetical protein
MSGAVTAALPASASTSTDGTAGCSAGSGYGPPRSGDIGGIARPAQPASDATCTPTGTDANSGGGDPPLIWNGGEMMATHKYHNRLIVTPIYWNPSGYPFPANYKSLINQYLTDAGHDSDTTGNVFSTLFEYNGSKGWINYRMVRAPAVNDTNAFPADGCTVNAGQIYSDDSGYTNCIDNAQIQTEINNVTTAHSFARDYEHIYVMFLPKHVETCFQPGNPVNQQCTINPTSSSAFCAYHSRFGNSPNFTVYANMPFPIYGTGGSTCSSEASFPTTESPNSNPDADVEVSPLSHEISEAVTDPDVNTGWYDDFGFENGDECAYKYGSTSGSAGALYNQTMNGHHYLVQEEFSNYNFNQAHGGCLQGYDPNAVPTVTSLRTTAGTITTGGSTAGGNLVVIHGSTLAGATGVKFGTTAATNLVLKSSRMLKVTVPAHSAGTVDVTVTNARGTRTTVVADHYTYS